MKISELKAARAGHVTKMLDLSNLGALTEAQETEYNSAHAEVKNLDAQIKRAEEAQALQASLAKPVDETKTYAAPENDPYVKDKSLIVGGIIRLAAMSKGNINDAARMGGEFYGEGHPVAKAIQISKALVTGVGTSGGFIVPPDFAGSIIDLLYAKTVVRAAGARTIPMPNGTMTVPKLTGGASAQWVGEAAAPGVGQPQYGQVVASAKKLMALVPVSNDMMRYAMAGFDAKVRDDVVMQIKLAEDIAFIRSLGSSFTPRGLRSFVKSGNIIVSTASYTLTTVAQELGGLQTKLEESNVPMAKPCWIMRPRTKNYLMNIQNSVGAYVFRDEMTKGTLLGWPFFSTTAIPNNLSDGTNGDCSELYAVDMNEAVIYESRQFELAISQEATYLDENGVQQNAFSQDMSLVRAITAEDFQMDHDEGVALVKNVRWAPTLA